MIKDDEQFGVAIHALLKELGWTHGELTASLVHQALAQVRHLRKQADQFTAERAETDKLPNCFICIECGRCSVDEDGCCVTCGRDCLAFEDGRLVKTGFVEHIESLERAAAERDAMRANYDCLVAKARQFERYPGGEGARVELRSALDALGQLDDDRKGHDWLACPDCRALSKSGHEPPRCDVFLANEQAASTACDCTPTAHGHLSSCPRYRP